MVGFKKGSKPWNKGKKTGIVPKSSFKKGQKPHNKKIIDYEEIKNLYNSGLSSIKIASLKKVSKRTVLRVLHKIKTPMRTGEDTRFKIGQIAHNKKEKIKLYCLMCKKEYSLKPSAAFRIGDKGQYRTKYCSAKCRQDSFKYNENVKRKATENIHKYLRSSRKGPTKPEKMFKEILIEMGLKENIGFFFQYTIGRKICDFVFPNENIIFEVQGDYIHVNPLYKHQAYSPKTFITSKGKKLYPAQISQLKKDKGKFDFLKKEGWKVYPVWESDIYKNKANIIEMIKFILNI